MSRHKDDRKFQKAGKRFSETTRTAGDALPRREAFTHAVAAALHEGFGHTGSAIKMVAATTDANERAVRNWFEAKNGPSGMHLVSLAQHSDHVLRALLTLADRADLIGRMELIELCTMLRRLLERLERAASDKRD